LIRAELSTRPSAASLSPPPARRRSTAAGRRDAIVTVDELG